MLPNYSDLHVIMWLLTLLLTTANNSGSDISADISSE